MRQKLIALLLLLGLVLTACQKPYEFEIEGQSLEMKPTTMLAQKDKTEVLVEQLNGGTLEEPIIIVDPYGMAPLSAIIEFETDSEFPIEMVVKGKTTAADLIFNFEPSTKHILPIVGLLSDQPTTVEIKVNNQIFTHEVMAHELPADVYLPEVTQKNLIENHNELYFTTPSSNGHVSAYDCNGDLRFILSSAHFWDVNILKDGKLVLSSDRIINSPYYTTGFVTMDLLGHIESEYRLPGGYHHDIDELPNGNFLVCSDDFNGKTVEDVIVEVDCETGNVVKTFDLKDIFDTKDGRSLNWTASDWFHNNSVDYEPTNNTLTVSGRHQDVVAVIDYDSGALKYLIGSNDNWSEEMHPYFLTPIGEEFEWQWAQHAATWIDSEHLMVFDNGMYRSKTKAESLAAEDNYSRMVIYKVDETNHTIEQVYQYGKERGFEYYSPYICDNDYLGDNHFLVTSGGISYLNGKINNDPGSLTAHDHMDAFISEIQDGELVFELKFPCNIYRAEKIDVTKFTTTSFEDSKLLGNLGVTKHKEIKVGDLLKEYDDFINVEQLNVAMPITFVDETDRIVVSGLLHKEDNLELVLVQDNKALVYPFQVDEEPGTCVAIFNSPKPDESFMIQTVSAEGLKGTYRLCYIYNNSLYDSTYTITY